MNFGSLLTSIALSDFAVSLRGVLGAEGGLIERFCLNEAHEPFEGAGDQPILVEDGQCIE